MKNVFMKNMLLSITSLCILLVSVTVFAANADDILGVWFNGEKDAKIEIVKCADKYCGRIVWLKEPSYPEGSKDGAPGTPRLDHNNPGAAMKKTPIIGLQIVYDFTFAGDDLWKDGRVYDPKNGKTYKGRMTLISPQQLDLRGYIGISLLGRTTTWTR
jgi:uncharacterized protein (DUF2147 family)